jgi:hypothetical protein
MTDIDTKELRRLMEAARECGAGATTREYADYLIALDEAASALLSEAEEAKRLREELAALRAAPAAEPVSVKPLEWVEDHGVSGMGPYRLFYAVTPLGRFVYGTDAMGDAYWHPPSSGVYTADSEESAKRAAERSWEKYALAEAGKFLRLAAVPTEAGR